jgi:hypothetical protein
MLAGRLEDYTALAEEEAAGQQQQQIQPKNADD